MCFQICFFASLISVVVMLALQVLCFLLILDLYMLIQCS